MELRGRWWNGRFGRLVRRDIWLLTETDGTTWRVEARTGDGDSRKWHGDYADERQARGVIAGMMDRTGGPGEWRDLSTVQGRPNAAT
jgi:hypothetical protein